MAEKTLSSVDYELMSIIRISYCIDCITRTRGIFERATTFENFQRRLKFDITFGCVLFLGFYSMQTRKSSWYFLIITALCKSTHDVLGWAEEGDVSDFYQITTFLIK